MDYSDVGGPSKVTEEWLVFFKNETHNHPTEIEPFGGAVNVIANDRESYSSRSFPSSIRAKP